RLTGMQTLSTAACPSLREYRRSSDGSQAVDVRATHRSLTATANVARQFRALHELSNEVTELRMAKILLLGSGRCGKTTLARALRWHDYTPEERLVKRHDVKEFPIPKGGIPSTPDINFLQWEVTYGEPAHGAAPRGILHVWDFGGQEIYHQTHRLFASEGAIFIIAVTTENEQGDRARADRNAEADQIRKLELEKLNQYREVSYWLEYIASAKGTPPGALGDVAAAAVQIAMTSPEDMSNDLFLQAAGFRDRLVESKIPRMHVRVREHEPVESIADLRAWVGKEIGKVADETGIRVPLLYAKISAWVEQCIRNRKRLSPLSWTEWREEVASRFPTGKRFSSRATTEIAMAIAEYLHACGRLFCVRGKRGIEKVVLNQQWFVDKLYKIINPSNHAIRDALREQTSTPVDQSKMESIIGQIDDIDENEFSTVMEMMDSCDMLVRIGSDRWLAVHPDLLSPLSISLEKELYETWSRVAHAQVDCGWENWSLAIHGHPSKLLLGASHFRKVCAWLARVMDGPLPTGLSRSAHGSKAARSTLGEHEDSDMRSKRAECRVWRRGMQMTMRSLDRDDAQESPAIAVRIEWNHDKEDGAAVDAPPKFSGGMFLQVLSTKAKEHAEALLAMMVADDGPLPEFRDRLVVGDHRPPSVSSDKIWCPRGSGQPGWSTKDGPTGPGMPWDVAISYRRDQKVFVDSLVRALEADNLNVYHDLEDTRIFPRPDKPQGSNLDEIYDHLRRARVLIVVPSESYFETPSLDGEKAVNFYCPVELAEAINSIYDKARPANRFLWVAPSGAVMRELVQDKINGVLKQYVAVVENSIRDVFSTPIGKRQVRAVNGADKGKVADVIERVGWGEHNYVDVPLDAGGQPEVATIVQRVRQALK
ncbi:MAG: TIR domain-containing protein, partial [Planctomycetota bacterium]